MHKRIVLKTILKFNVNLKLLLRLFNCEPVGGKKNDNCQDARYECEKKTVCVVICISTLTTCFGQLTIVRSPLR